jgi:surfeit locus 1 family protein
MSSASITAKSLLGFTTLMLLVFAVLVGLGIWQIKRLHWKEGLIAEIETRSKGAPIALKDATAMVREGRDPSYYRVRASGRLDNTKERYLFTVSEERTGWDVITPLKTADGEIVLVDRGFVPDNLKDPSTRPEGEIEGLATVTGIAQLPASQGLFIPNNEPETNRWFWRDLNAMAQSMFAGQPAELAPFFLEAEKGEVPGGWPEGGQTRLDLPNNHLQYAITWFLLAAAILILYGVYVFRARR